MRGLVKGDLKTIGQDHTPRGDGLTHPLIEIARGKRTIAHLSSQTIGRSLSKGGSHTRPEEQGGKNPLLHCYSAFAVYLLETKKRR